MPVPSGYALDLTGANPSNYIVGETRTFGLAADRMFVPTAGPFFSVGLEVRNSITNELLAPMVHYRCLNMLQAASQKAGKEVLSVIWVTDENVPGVTINYHCIGGVYEEMAATIALLLAATPPSPYASWGSLVGAPVQMPPAAHKTDFMDIYNMGSFINVVEKLREAVANGDGGAIAAIFQYINNRLSGYVTTPAMNDALAALPVPPIIFKTYADLRAATGMVTGEKKVYIVQGKTDADDQAGNIFMWDGTSTLTDDNSYVVKPDVVTLPNPGRFVSILLRSLGTNSVINISTDTTLTAATSVTAVVDTSIHSADITVELPPATIVMDVYIRREDNGGSVAKVVIADGTTDVILHNQNLISVDISPSGKYPFFYLMGAGDFWHIRSDGNGRWFVVGRLDSSIAGTIMITSLDFVPPGGWSPLGQSLYKSDWPWMVDLAGSGLSSSLTDDAVYTARPGTYRDNAIDHPGTDTITLPTLHKNFIRPFDWFGTDTVGVLQSDAIQNITGSLAYISANSPPYAAGAFYTVNDVAAAGASAPYTGGSVHFDASRVARTDTETRPSNVHLPHFIKIM